MRFGQTPPQELCTGGAYRHFIITLQEFSTLLGKGWGQEWTLKREGRDKVLKILPPKKVQFKPNFNLSNWKMDQEVVEHNDRPSRLLFKTIANKKNHVKMQSNIKWIKCYERKFWKTMWPDPFFSFPLFVLQYCVYTPKLFERGGFFFLNSMLYNGIFRDLL